jgi:hypothetical protein
MDGLSFGIGQSIGHRIFGGIFGSSTPYSSEISDEKSNEKSNVSIVYDISNTSNTSNKSNKSNTPNVSNLDKDCNIHYDDYFTCIRYAETEGYAEPELYCKNEKKLLTDCEKSKYDL